MSDSDEMNEDISLGFAVAIAEGHDAVAQIKADLQVAIDNGFDLPVTMIPPLIRIFEAQESLINTLYEFWALVGDKIQEEEGN